VCQYLNTLQEKLSGAFEYRQNRLAPAYNAPPDPLAGGKGMAAPLPKPTPVFAPSGRADPHNKILRTPLLLRFELIEY